MVTTPLKHISQNGNLPQIGVKMVVTTQSITNFLEVPSAHCCRKEGAKGSRQCQNNWRFWPLLDHSLGVKNYARWLQNGVVNFTFECSLKKRNKHRKNGSNNINKNNGPASQRCSSMTNWHCNEFGTI